ncbi:MAG: hypothetical protein HZB19_12290 [Chloroflexi bacterium]|nr:hypothetical protein [Chloroflexota bacterium]
MRKPFSFNMESYWPTGAGISRLEQLTELSEVELSQLHGIGPSAVSQLRRALAVRGLSFAGEK